jgi:hypothetical protein
MGEGIAASSSNSMSTSVIYSCMGIAFINRTTQRGGLYHYPAGTCQNPNVAGTIRQMCNDIQPDQIMVTPAKMAGGFVVNYGSKPEDVAAVVNLLKQLNCQNIQMAEAGSLASLSWQGGQPVFNEPIGTGEGLSIPQPSMRQTMSTTGRQIGSDAWYYGVDGESDDSELGPVLPTGNLPAGKKKKEKKCTIM